MELEFVSFTECDLDLHPKSILIATKSQRIVLSDLSVPITFSSRKNGIVSLIHYPSMLRLLLARMMMVRKRNRAKIIRAMVLFVSNSK